MKSINIFERYAQKYDAWFDKNKLVYESEIHALKRFIPKKGKGVEIGVGTARFAIPLGIKLGIEPAKTMAEIAQKRGVEVIKAKAENLPFKNSSFDFVLIMVTICFVQNPIQSLKETKRVLKPGGALIIGMIDKESFLGKLYKKKKKSKFYTYAHFYSVREVLNWLKKLEFKNIQTCQTIFKPPHETTKVERVEEGYGKGGFVVIYAQKNKESI